MKTVFGRLGERAPAPAFDAPYCLPSSVKSVSSVDKTRVFGLNLGIEVIYPQMTQMGREVLGGVQGAESFYLSVVVNDAVDGRQDS